jgi:hypothetical protein
MVKLNERKMHWIIQEKLRGRGAGEIALIQRVSHRPHHIVGLTGLFRTGT